MRFNLSTCALTVAAISATAKGSNLLPGSAFDRFVIIYFENQNYDKAIGDRKSPFKPLDVLTNTLQPVLGLLQMKVFGFPTTLEQLTRHSLTTCPVLLETILA